MLATSSALGHRGGLLTSPMKPQLLDHGDCAWIAAAPGTRRSCVPEKHAVSDRHYPRSLIAFHNRGGLIGSSRMRTPVALAMALASVAGGATIGVSPTPRTP